MNFGRAEVAELRLPTVIRKVKFTDFVKVATSPKIQLTKFRFHTNSKVHSLLSLTKYGNFSKKILSLPTRLEDTILLGLSSATKI